MFGSLRKGLVKLSKELELESGLDHLEKRKRLMYQISYLLIEEEIMEKHRSRLDRLKDGDRKIILFQAKAKERYKSNSE